MEPEYSAMTKIAVLLPCWNEELTIQKVISDFKNELPDAEIYVYDNNSTDTSAALAEQAGAIVRHVPIQGKGHVVRQMFQEIDADCYLMVDTDDTYPAEYAKELLAPILAGKADMVTGDRLSTTYHTVNTRPFHSFGNSLVCTMIRLLFSYKIADAMTGYRAFSRRFVRNCPILCSGFELETEMTLFAMDKKLPLIEIPIPYRARPEGSHSKLNTCSDGLRVLRTIFHLFKAYRPLLFFGWSGLFVLLIAAGLFTPVLIEYIETGLVPKFPTLFCAITLGVIGIVIMLSGVIMNSIKHYFDCLFELHMKK